MNNPECHITVIPYGELRQNHERHLLLDCLNIREQVFCEEQGVSYLIDQDGKDNESGHILLWDQDTPIGTLRFRKTGEGLKLERIAVLKPFRGLHYGKALVIAGIQAARNAGNTEPVYLHAQKPACEFYLGMGFTIEGETFMEAEIPHVLMRLSAEAESALLATSTDICPILP
ncbi:MAG: GNAT family N-acetyltransferase [Sphaerochaetaceae bacterium]